MNLNIVKTLFVPIIITASLASCKKEDTSFNPGGKGTITVEYDNIAGGANLMLHTGTYTNSSGEAFKVTNLKYYVSNFAFTKSDGTIYTVPQNESYFLIDESKPGTSFPEFGIPEGEYTTLTFTLGVDSARNTKDISERQGVLDPAGDGADMYWGWNSGYIFFKLEGTAAASPEAGNVFMYHIGGFGGYSSPTMNNIKTVTIDLTSRGTAQVREGKTSNIHLFVDILKMFYGKRDISIAADPVVMFDSLSADIADNYTDMFTHDHTEN